MWNQAVVAYPSILEELRDYTDISATATSLIKSRICESMNHSVT
jgi:hypothetical protein